MTAPASTNDRILIVDDHPIVRAGFADRLAKQPGFEICGEAEDAQSALEAVTGVRPHVVILDVSLKTGNGIKLIPQIKDRHPEAKVLIVSMYDDLRFVEDALRAGADGYVTKREAPSEIVTAVRTVLTGKTYLKPETARLLNFSPEAGTFHTVTQEQVNCLTPRELETFCLIGKRLQPREIGETLGISPKTVDTYRAHLREKLGIYEPAELQRCAIQWVEQSEKSSE